MSEKDEIYRILEEDEEPEEKYSVAKEFGYPPQGALSGLLLMGFPSDRIYMVYDCGDVYYFRYLGNDTFGIKTQRLLDKAPEHVEMGEKDKLYRKDKILDCHLIRRKSISTTQENCGSFHFTYEENLQKFILLGRPSEQQVMDFLSDVSAVYPAKSAKTLEKEALKAQALSENAQVLEQERNLSLLKKLQSLKTVLSVIAAVSCIGGVIFCSLYTLWGSIGILVSIVSLFLCLWKPTYCSLFNKESHGVPMVTLAEPICFSSFMLLFLAWTNLNYLSYTHLIVFSTVVAVVLSVLLYIRSRVAQKNFGFVCAILFISILFGFGFIETCNTIFEDPEPAETAIGEITDMWISHSTKGGDSYYISLHTHSEELELSIDEEEYEKLSVGDRIPVYFYSGGLGIPFVDIIKY